MTAVRKNLLDKIIVKHRTDLINHSYFIFLKVRDLDQQSKWPRKKLQVFNIYNNQIRQGYIWAGNTL